ncbi:peroxin-20 Pex20-Penicillium chrysogenum [Penicillium tannophilum]|nr:peroxin-20 Pex20-Penicillium chrysogenum [Penicillium tannophilum]
MDSLCGPSNALQNAQKHTSVDRTLQQDRLISRQPPTQGFRSQGQEGILDPEFASFEASRGVPDLPVFENPAQFGRPAQLPAAAHQNAGWAHDFQNLHISGPAPPQLQHQAQGPSGFQAQGGWHEEFMRQQQNQPAAASLHLARNHPNTNSAYQSPFAAGYPMYNSSTYQAPQEAHVQHSAPTEKFDESAFEAAFNQAQADLELQAAEAAPAPQANVHDASPIDPFNTAEQDTQFGSDDVVQSEQQTEARAQDADALARAAGQILTSVSHDQSEKFQQSNFLALMRRIRDREVEVKGDDFAETAQSLHPGGPYYPSQSPPLQDPISSDIGKESPFPADRA